LPPPAAGSEAELLDLSGQGPVEIQSWWWWCGARSVAGEDLQSGQGQGEVSASVRAMWPDDRCCSLGKRRRGGSCAVVVVLEWAWWRPRRQDRALRSQDLRGRAYSSIAGDASHAAARPRRHAAGDATASAVHEGIWLQGEQEHH
jgi:hypothetical protein